MKSKRAGTSTDIYKKNNPLKEDKLLPEECIYVNEYKSNKSGKLEQTKLEDKKDKITQVVPFSKIRPRYLLSCTIKCF